MRYHWGLGVGHTYSHIRDNDAKEANSTQASLQGLYPSSSTLNFKTTRGVSQVSQRFDDLDNDVSFSDLGWDSYDYDRDEAERKVGGKDISLLVDDSDAFPVCADGFDDLDPGLSLADIDALQWSHDEQDEDECVSDNDSAASVMYDVTYGSDWGDGYRDS